MKDKIKVLMVCHGNVKEFKAYYIIKGQNGGAAGSLKSDNRFTTGDRMKKYVYS